jgi:hypothetical protein
VTALGWQVCAHAGRLSTPSKSSKCFEVFKLFSVVVADARVGLKDLRSPNGSLFATT